MKRLLVLLMIISECILAQEYDKKWVIGIGAVQNNILVNFDGPNLSPIVSLLSGVNHRLSYAATNICDTAGNLAFYTNGYFIWDSTHQLMQNCDTLSPSAFTTQDIADNHGLGIFQGCLILPHPGSTNLYYLFHVGVDSTNGSCCSYPFNLYYSLIDMQLNNGKGSVVSSNNIIINDTLELGHITACKHANGRDWWIITHRYKGNTFIKYLLTPSGISGPYYQNIGKPKSSGVTGGWGYTNFGPDGQYYGKVYFENIAHKTIELFKFDRCTGMLSDSVYIEQPSVLDSFYSSVNCAFSPNSRYFYVSCTWYIYQYDMQAVDIANSKILVATSDTISQPFSVNSFGKIIKAPDGKLYVTPTSNNHPWLSTIELPDSPGVACNVVQHNIPIYAVNGEVLPNMPNYNLGAWVGSPCDTIQYAGLTPGPSANMNVTASPNPASDNFTVSYNWPANKNAVIVFYDAIGNIISRHSLYGSFKYLQIDCTHWSNGIYYYQLLMDGIKTQAGKVVVIK